MEPSIVAQQLAGQAPLILIYVVSIIFCLVFITRYPLPAVMALVALGIGLLALVGYAITNAYLFHLRLEQAWDDHTLGLALSTLGMVTNGARAVALALLVAAVFISRKPQTPRNE